jgi:hypothetical protein
MQFLEWSLEIYQQKAGNFNFNEVKIFDPIDKLQVKTNYNNIPNFRLEMKDEFKTDFGSFIDEPAVLNFLLDLMHQSGLVFKNLKNYRALNIALSSKINTYIND